MAKSEKLFEVLEIIKKSPNLSPKELAELCNVSERAIYRYIHTLSKVGILVSYRKGGYKLQGYYGDILNNFKPESLEAIRKLLISGMRLHSDEKVLQHGREFLKLIDMNIPREGSSEPGEIDIISEAVRALNHGGIITIGHSSIPDIINPILTIETISANLLDLIFSSLIKFDEAQRPMPDAAKSWEISYDGLIWTFFLREDITFHDGYPLTAQDVEFTYNAMITPKNMSPRAMRYDLIEKVETDGDYIFRLYLKQPFSAFISRLNHAIAPKHLLDGVDLRNTKFNQEPVGSGPFKLTHWSEEDTIILEANRGYFRKDRPILDKLIFKSYTDRNSALEAIARKEMDIALNLTASDLLFIGDGGTFRIYSLPGPSYYTWIFNLKDPIFKDIRLRRALDYAIDKEAIIKNQLKSHGVVCTGPFAVDSWAYNPDVKPTPYNVERAKELLKQAGWQYNNSDNVLIKDGKALEITINISNNLDILERIAKAIGSQLMQMGIKVLVDDSPRDPESKDKTFQTILAAISVGAEPDNTRRSWHSTDSDANLASYSNRFVDDLMDLGRAESDIEKRRAVYYKIHELIHDDCPAIFLASAFEYIGSNYRFRNDELHSMMHFLLSMKDWQIVDKSKQEDVRRQPEKLVVFANSR